MLTLIRVTFHFCHLHPRDLLGGLSFKVSSITPAWLGVGVGVTALLSSAFYVGAISLLSLPPSRYSPNAEGRLYLTVPNKKRCLSPHLTKCELDDKALEETLSFSLL